jgi:pre-mRNA-processing factor 17
LWEYYGQRRCIRTYVGIVFIFIIIIIIIVIIIIIITNIGHFEAVVDLCFNNDGTKFLSCSFDKYIKLWNTETGMFEKYISALIFYVYAGDGFGYF